MKLNQLLEVLKSIEKLIYDKHIISYYQNLVNSLYGLSNNSSDDLIKQIENEKNIIINLHKDFIQKHWTENQNNSLKELNKNNVLGRKAIRKMLNLFQKHNESPYELAREIEIIINDLNILKEETNNLLKSLEPILFSTDETAFKEQKNPDNLLFISFAESSFFENINMLEKFCRIWNKILMSFVYLTNETVFPIHIYDIKLKSITFTLEPESIKAIIKGVYEVLKGYKKVLEVRKLQLEINSLNLSNKIEIENLLEDEVINIVDILSVQVSYDLISQYNWLKKPNKEEIQKNIQIALKQIVNFIEKGGKIESTQSKELHDLNEKIISILKNIKELEMNNNFDKEFHIDISFEQEVEKFD